MSTRDPMDTRHKMIRAGYTFIADSTCKGCKRPIQWWKTMNGKNCPFDPIAGDHDLTTVHWATCPQSKNFKADAREDAKLEAAKQEGAQRAVRREANYAAPKGRDEREVRALRQKTNARAVVLVGDNGAFSMAWRNGIPSEDLRHEVITAANEMKAVIEKGGRWCHSSTWATETGRTSTWAARAASAAGSAAAATTTASSATSRQGAAAPALPRCVAGAPRR
jgi:hypothetical protein